MLQEPVRMYASCWPGSAPFTSALFSNEENHLDFTLCPHRLARRALVCRFEFYKLRPKVSSRRPALIQRTLRWSDSLDHNRRIRINESTHSQRTLCLVFLPRPPTGTPTALVPIHTIQSLVHSSSHQTCHPATHHWVIPTRHVIHPFKPNPFAPFSTFKSHHSCHTLT